jgi:hypothetical protein
MLDFLYIVITLIFFYVGASFTRGCERLSEEERDG